MEMLRRVAEPLIGPLATAGIVVILVIFILLYREDLRDRLIRLAGARDLHRTMAAMDDAAYRLSRFFLAQTGMNTAFGLLISGALWLIGVPNPLLWGFVAALMRFVPFIGVFVTVTGPILMALAVDPGWTMLVWVLVLFGVSELLMGQVFEPLVFGHSTGLSPIAVIAAATFWTWLWGPIGLLLAVPLTVCLVVLGRHVERLEFLEVMLGDQPPLDPEETFYQRALAGDASALAEQAERCLKEKPWPNTSTPSPCRRCGWPRPMRCTARCSRSGGRRWCAASSCWSRTWRRRKIRSRPPASRRRRRCRPPGMRRAPCSACTVAAPSMPWPPACWPRCWPGAASACRPAAPPRRWRRS
ncbi:AI-2E family transporter [Paeniroseomonas aquatica]|uniref:AI-2E family transporter n=1 Tax=Paeniroseomonas aquatica TaxID=373043 RepID=UPI00360742E6